MEARARRIIGAIRRLDDADRAGWTPRRPSPARASVVVLQVIALGLVGLALAAALWWLLTSTAGTSGGTLASAILVVPVTAAMLALGGTGLRRWLAGGPPARLYGFDALPILFLLVTAGPGALQDPLGAGIVTAFVLPAMATFLATND